MSNAREFNALGISPRTQHSSPARLQIRSAHIPRLPCDYPETKVSPPSRPARGGKSISLALTLGFATSLYAAPPPFATGKHVLAFAANGEDGVGQRGGIFVMRDDGTQVRQLTRFSEIDLVWSNDPRKPLPDDQPSISPDGKKVAFTSKRNGQFDIWVMDINGGRLQPLTTSAAPDLDPTWSPDGLWIAYVSGAGGGALQIWRMRPDGSGKEQLTTGTDDHVDPAWHPDSTSLAYSRKVGVNDYEIYVRAKATPTSTTFSEFRITNQSGEDRFPAFSPSGTRLAYTSERTFDLQVPYGHIVARPFALPNQDGAAVNLTDLNQSLGDFRRGGAGPTFSPDGTKLAGWFSDGLLTTSRQRLMRLATTGTARPTAALALAHPFRTCINPCYGWELDTDGDGRPDHMENANGLLLVSDFVAKRDAGDNPPFGSRIALPDLNHDGIPDLAILGAHDAAGPVDASVVYLAGGTRHGPVVGSNAAVGSASDDLPTYLERTDFPGFEPIRKFTTVVAGDFNGDGFKDLAVGGTQPVGAAERGHLYFWTGRGGNKGVIEMVGVSGVMNIVAGDFNGDGRSDVVVASPFIQGLSMDGKSYTSGLVRAFFGGTPGLVGIPMPLLEEETTSGFQVRTGAALATGDLNGDGPDDLAVGAPNRNGVAPGSGAVTVGTGAVCIRLSGPGHTPFRLSRTLTPINEFPSVAGMYFGTSLAIGDFDGDGERELAVGAPLASLTGGVTNAGGVYIFSKFTAGETIQRRVITLPGALANDNFGAALVAGDFTGDGADDLAVAVPGRSRVVILPGTKRNVINSSGGTGSVRSAGLSGAPTIVLDPTLFGLGASGSDPFPNVGSVGLQGKFPYRELDPRQPEDRLLGLNTLAAADLDRDGQSDLFIGVPFCSAFPEERLDSIETTLAGAVVIRYGTRVGQFRLEPSRSFTPPDEFQTLTLVWRHPEQWRLLREVHFRFADAHGVWAWAKFEEESGLLGLYDPDQETFAAEGFLGDPGELVSPFARVDLSRAKLTGSGPLGLEMTMTLPIKFLGAAAGRELQVEVFATDDRGGSQGWDSAGSIHVLRSADEPYLEILSLDPSPGGAGLRLQLHGRPGRRLRLESSNDFRIWSSVQEFDNPTGRVTFDPQSSASEGRYFRVVAL